MAVSVRLAVLRCDIGNPTSPNPPVAAYRDVLGPGGPATVLGGWREATYGYLDTRDSLVVPDVLRMTASDLVEGAATRDPSDGRVAYSMSRRKVGDRAVELAQEAGHDLGEEDGVVVIANQGRLRHEGRPVRPYRGGSASLSDGRPMCDLAVDASLYLMAHEVGHVLGFLEAYGILTGSWSWNEPPFDRTPQYGDPFCVMSAEVRPGGGGSFGYLGTAPLSPDWPSATFGSAGPGPSLALVRRVHPQATTDCVLRLRFDEWHGPHPRIRLHPATDPTPGRPKLLVLDGPGRSFGPDVEDTVYVEYRRAEGLDQGLTPDPSGTAVACSAVVVHELVRTRLCVPSNDDTDHLPVCVADDGTTRARGRLQDEGLQVHFRARIPVPPPVSRDWRSRSGALVSVTDVAPDGSWVEVDVRPGRASDRGVTIGRPSRRELSRTSAFTGHDTLPALCGGPRLRPPGRPVRPSDRPLAPDRVTVARRFRFTIDVVQEEVTLRAAVRSFGNDPPNGPTGADPQVTWSVGGVDVLGPAMGEPPRHQTVTVTLPVHRYDLTTGDSLPTADGLVTLGCTAQADGSVVMTSVGANGGFTLPVTVTAAPGGNRGEVRRQSLTVLFQGHQRTRDAALARELRACLSRILDPSRLTQLESPPWLRGPRVREEGDDPQVRVDADHLDVDPVLLDLAARVHVQLVTAGDRARARDLEEVADRLLGIRLTKT